MPCGWQLTPPTITPVASKPALSLGPRGASQKLAGVFLPRMALRLQHDLAEFADFLMPRVVTSRGEAWCGRSLEAEGCRITDSGPLNRCLRLISTPQHHPDIQELISYWHRQQSLHAFTAAPPWLFLQLPRFKYGDSGIEKLHQPYLLPGELQLPVFVSATDMSVTWFSYHTFAIIRHHGASPNSCHYTTMVRGISVFILDDAAEPKIADTAALEDTSTSMYVVVACLSSCIPLSRHTPSLSDGAVVLSPPEKHGPRKISEDR